MSIVYWGDSSSTKETLYILVTGIPSKLYLGIKFLMHTHWCCTFSVWFLAVLWLVIVRDWWVVTILVTNVFNLKRLLHSILIGWKLKMCTLNFQTLNWDLPFFFGQSQKLCLLRWHMHVMPDEGVILHLTSIFTNFTVRPYVYLFIC